ncbi:MAG: hypothetical protein M1822_007765 [Bathelium mastoideum]|nr:MAG: hypothetical protein M1822_007765 [Bathelium mastoideum]
MLRHGYLRPTIPWREVNYVRVKGLWVIVDESKQPDVVVYYCHGGGFSMGSSYFYIEFLLAWVALLKNSGFRNPALFALEYDLAPDSVYPTQLRQTLAGYEYVLSRVHESSLICVGGDSAGATLILSMLLQKSVDSNKCRDVPGLAIMISPWVTLVSVKNHDTPSDYLNGNTLHIYGNQYAGPMASLDDPLVSPGKCRDLKWWKRASPLHGWSFLYGSEEVFAPETRGLIHLLKRTDVDVSVHEESGSIHAWPVASLFLGRNRDERQHGLRNIVKVMRQSIGSETNAKQNGAVEKLVAPLREKAH